MQEKPCVRQQLSVVVRALPYLELPHGAHSNHSLVIAVSLGSNPESPTGRPVHHHDGRPGPSSCRHRRDRSRGAHTRPACGAVIAPVETYLLPGCRGRSTLSNGSYRTATDGICQNPPSPRFRLPTAQTWPLRLQPGRARRSFPVRLPLEHAGSASGPLVQTVTAPDAAPSNRFVGTIAPDDRTGESRWTIRRER